MRSFSVGLKRKRCRRSIGPERSATVPSGRNVVATDDTMPASDADSDVDDEGYDGDEEDEGPLGSGYFSKN